MIPYEIMLSESQERMLLVVAKGREAEIREVFNKWELDAVEIGRVTGDGILRVRMEGHLVGELPVKILTEEAPVYQKATERPSWLDALLAFDPIALPEPADYNRALLSVVSAPSVASKEWVWRQYDHQVGINTLVLPGSDAAVLRIKGTRKAIALTTDGNSRYVLLDPYAGAAMAVAEAARNLTCSGAQPLAVTDGLNFGSPGKPEILWQFARAVDGIADACLALEIPVVSGNVSFYNETGARAIPPTPIIGMAGLLEDAERRTTQWFKGEGDRIALLGPDDVSLGGSEFLWTLYGKVAGRLAPLNLKVERSVQSACRAAIEQGLAASAHDCSEGGLAVALAEACVAGPALLGADVALPPGARSDVVVFGEGPSRIVVSVPGRGERHFEALMREWGIPWRWIGTVGGERLRVRVGNHLVLSLPLEPLGDAWRNGFARVVG
jgi:phosphoribosylformylglycinamidine synthase